jgi:hypothetical protein
VKAITGKRQSASNFITLDVEVLHVCSALERSVQIGCGGHLHQTCMYILRRGLPGIAASSTRTMHSSTPLSSIPRSHTYQPQPQVAPLEIALEGPSNLRHIAFASSTTRRDSKGPALLKRNIHHTSGNFLTNSRPIHIYRTKIWMEKGFKSSGVRTRVKCTIRLRQAGLTRLAILANLYTMSIDKAIYCS